MRNPVVVGVDGSKHGDRALTFAVQEARRHHCGIRVVHTFEENLPMISRMPPLSRYPLVTAAQSVVDAAVQRINELGGGDIDVDEVIDASPPARVLVKAGRDARMIVLGRRPLGHAVRLVTGSTSVATAARAHCPVVAVPAEWNPESDHGRVVVGVDDETGSTEALEVAFDAAAQRGDTLHVVHAWKPPVYYADLPELREIVDEWHSAAEVTLSEVLAGWREKYPDVHVDVSIERDGPAHVLTEASRTADLLVVGRRGVGRVSGLPVGSVARSVLVHAHCPVALAPHAE